MDLEAGERDQRIAEEDRKYYLEIGRPLTLKSHEMHMKFARQALEYEKEELEQLEKMYKADDLTEETEKIVLKRQRDAVERGRMVDPCDGNRPRKVIEVRHSPPGSADRGDFPPAYAAMEQRPRRTAAGT